MDEAPFPPGSPAWPSTRWTFILGAADPAPQRRLECWEGLVTRYWRPVYSHIRSRWKRDVEDAKDLTQDFFTRLIEAQTVNRAEPRRGRFRSFLRACLENFLRDEHKHRSRLKRGGEAVRVPFDRAEEMTSTEGDPFDREWKRVIVSAATEELERKYRCEGKERYWSAFQLYYLTDPPAPYESIARTLNCSETDVTNYLHHARRTLRDHIQAVIRDSVDTEEDLRQEYGELFGSENPTSDRPLPGHP